jgi:hypothetical protein
MADNKLVILEESVLLSMASNPNFTSQFQFLTQLKNVAAKSTCGKCSAKASQRINMINNVKQIIVNLGAEKKSQLKQLLKADKVKVRVGQNGKVVEYTF